MLFNRIPIITSDRLLQLHQPAFGFAMPSANALTTPPSAIATHTLTISNRLPQSQQSAIAPHNPKIVIAPHSSTAPNSQ